MSDILPRVIRLRDAAHYLGMDKNRFNTEVRPFVIEIAIGSQGIGFDRLDLDQWWEDYKACNGCQAKKGGRKPWHKSEHRASSKEAKSGTLTKGSGAIEFEKALGRATSRKQSDT